MLGIMLFTRLAVMGAAAGSVVGGYISKALGGRYTTGAIIGGIIGGILGGLAYKGIMALRRSAVAGTNSKAQPANTVDPYPTNRNPDMDYQSGKSLARHAKDHGGLSSDQYLQKAREFMDGPFKPGMESFMSSEGTYFRYNPITNEFGIINSYGGISTYYYPDTGMSYWLEQFAKYAPK